MENKQFTLTNEKSITITAILIVFVSFLVGLPVVGLIIAGIGYLALLEIESKPVIEQEETEEEKSVRSDI